MHGQGQGVDVSGLFDSDLFSDVKIKSGEGVVFSWNGYHAYPWTYSRIGERGFQCHRNVLSYTSEYFSKLLNPTSGFCDKAKATIELYEDDLDAIETMLWYIYSDEYGIGPKTPESHPQAHLGVCVAAKKYLLDDLYEVASKCLYRSMRDLMTILENRADGPAMFKLLRFWHKNKEHVGGGQDVVPFWIREHMRTFLKVDAFHDSLAEPESVALSILNSMDEALQSEHNIQLEDDCKATVPPAPYKIVKSTFKQYDLAQHKKWEQRTQAG